MFDDAGNVIAIIPEGRPIQEIVNARKALELKNVELERFAYIASHDLKEPLRMVHNFMGLMEKNYATQLDEKAKKYIHFALDATSRMTGLINDLLEYAKIGAEDTPFEEIDCNVLIQEFIPLFKAELEEKNGEIHFQYLPTIKAQRTPLKLLFQNLINNALKYQNSNKPPRIQISAIESTQFWQFCVADNGIGINGNIFPSSVKMPDGKLWFPTIKGVAIMDPKNDLYDSQEVAIQIEGLRIGDLFINENEKIIIPPGTFKFDISFTSVDFDDPENTQFFYRFTKKDMEYIPIGNDRIISLTSIENGNYTIEIVGYKSGRWTEPATISFRVDGFFFESNAFKLMIAFLIFLAGALSIYIVKKISRGKKLEEMVLERTKELEASTTELQTALINIEQQNFKLKEITWQQSHIVRAPLTRIMGILHVLKHSNNFKHLNKSKEDLIQELEDGLMEMDDIIRTIHKSSEKENNPHDEN
ncbi:Histidine kinase-, DNA gyrase B-, and HSP90-like ATPase [Belliella buryatensis]|uniref:histidine kinase n=1 Tax=Belliella buryatensis TaxID=1500549 RepID=A0A239GN10_9BACT|nr:histidine kinase dimerization/phospho-acceptor domain-containing protein [Belliella buryatensis]SNS70255.1 Histidine kinase-, DNA gyrase B-, and HSP90-like ATPase [Belliella buryatensis]